MPRKFVNRVYGFHDSCIKELNYVSGAYVAEDFGMYPLNTKRCLKLIIQSQMETVGTIEMEFSGVDFFYYEAVLGRMDLRNTGSFPDHKGRKNLVV